VYDDTLIIFLADNGACAEDIPEGLTVDVLVNQLMIARSHTRSGEPVQFGNNPKLMPGAENTYQSYGPAWANLSNAPFRLYKHWIHEGGIATPLIAHWPAGIHDQGGIRHTPGYLPDIMATLLDVTGTRYAGERNGKPVPALEGASLRPAFEAEAVRMLAPLVERGRFDAQKDLADPYPVKVFPDALGLAPEGREHLVHYGDIVFASLGPENEVYRRAMAHAPTAVPWIREKCGRAALAPGSLGAAIYAAADSGEVTEDEAGLLVRSFLSAGVDTTMNGIGAAIHCLATHPGRGQCDARTPSSRHGHISQVIDSPWYRTHCALGHPMDAS
jgi:hypothetical protein